jgi:hypothetical protein
MWVDIFPASALFPPDFIVSALTGVLAVQLARHSPIAMPASTIVGFSTGD